MKLFFMKLQREYLQFYLFLNSNLNFYEIYFLRTKGTKELVDNKEFLQYHLSDTVNAKVMLSKDKNWLGFPTRSRDFSCRGFTAAERQNSIAKGIAKIPYISSDLMR